MTFGHFLQNIPNFGRSAFDHFAGTPNGMHEAKFFETPYDEWLEKYQCHFLGQTALVQFKFGTNDDDGSTRVINAFAQKILPESALFPLEHVTE